MSTLEVWMNSRNSSDLGSSSTSRATFLHTPFFRRVVALRAFFFLVPSLAIATGFRVATFVRTTLPFQKNADPHRDDTAEEGSTTFPQRSWIPKFTQSRRLVRSHKRLDKSPLYSQMLRYQCLNQRVKTEDGHAMMKFDTFSLTPQLAPKQCVEVITLCCC